MAGLLDNAVLMTGINPGATRANVDMLMRHRMCHRGMTDCLEAMAQT